MENKETKKNMFSRTVVRGILNAAILRLKSKFDLLTYGTTYNLLCLFRWNHDNVMSSIQQRGLPALLESKGLSTTIKIKEEGGKCKSCLDPDKRPLVGLSCCHYSCKECWNHNVKYNIASGNISAKCMTAGCHHIVSSDQVIHWCTAEVYDAYTNLMLDMFIFSKPDFKSCACSNVFFIPPKGGDPKATITCCNETLCSNCLTSPHLLLTCEQNKIWTFSYNAFVHDTLHIEKYEEETDQLQLCKDCGTLVQRMVGCSEITCPNCQLHMCFHCSSPYSVGHKFECDEIRKFKIDQQKGKMDIYEMYKIQTKELEKHNELENVVKTKCAEIGMDHKFPGTLRNMRNKRESLKTWIAFYYFLNPECQVSIEFRRDLSRVVELLDYLKAMLEEPFSASKQYHIQREIHEILQKIDDLCGKVTNDLEGKTWTFA